MTGQRPFADLRDGRRHVALKTPGIRGIQAVYLRISVLPAAIITVASVAVALYALAASPSAGTLRAAVVGITAGVVVMLIAAIAAANVGYRRLGDQLWAARALVRRAQPELQELADQVVLRGEQPALLAPAAVGADSDDPLQSLVQDLAGFHYTAGQVILRVAERTGGLANRGRFDQRVEIFVNLARRMQSLVHREIEMLDELEAQVEDPDLLKGLFTVDHLATRMRRQSESLAVLGGSASRRQWTRQVTMHEVLRAAVAEVEQYSRVKVVPPVEGVLRGGAVSDVIHLVAELVENATKFSAPRTQALIRAQLVTAGVAIEIEDRGLGMVAADMQRMNALLADPAGTDIDELLRDGRIGLYVVSTLAHRHAIRVQLQGNIYGGTSAIIVLPTPLLEGASDHQLPRAAAAARPEQEAPVLASRVLVGEARAGGPAGTAGTAEFPPWPQEHRNPSWRPFEAARPPQAVQSPQAVQALQSPQALQPPQAVQAQAANSVPPASSFQPPAAQPPHGERPPLPKRQAQASLAPELRERFADPAAASTRRTEPPGEQLSGLMADFLKGVSRSEQEEPPAGAGAAR
jgi:hypothetical protein